MKKFELKHLQILQMTDISVLLENLCKLTVEIYLKNGIFSFELEKIVVLVLLRERVMVLICLYILGRFIKVI